MTMWGGLIIKVSVLRETSETAGRSRRHTKET